MAVYLITLNFWTYCPEISSLPKPDMYSEGPSFQDSWLCLQRPKLQLRDQYLPKRSLCRSDFENGTRLYPARKVRRLSAAGYLYLAYFATETTLHRRLVPASKACRRLPECCKSTLDTDIGLHGKTTA